MSDRERPEWSSFPQQGLVSDGWNGRGTGMSGHRVAPADSRLCVFRFSTATRSPGMVRPAAGIFPSRLMMKSGA